MECKNCGNIESDDSVFCKKCNSLIFNAELYFEKYIKTNECNESQNVEIDSGETMKEMKPSKYSWAETPAERELRINKVAPANKNKPTKPTPDTPQKNTNQKSTEINQAANPQPPKKEIIPLQTGKAEFKFDSASARAIEINNRTHSAHISTKKTPTESPRKTVDSPPREDSSNPKQNDASDSSGASEAMSPVVTTIFRACKYLFVLMIIIGLLKSCGRGGSGSSGAEYECEYSVYGTPVCTLR